VTTIKAAKAEPSGSCESQSWQEWRWTSYPIAGLIGFERRSAFTRKHNGTTMTLISAAPFLVMDPLGNIALFLTALSRVEPGRQRSVIARELPIALVVLLSFLFVGHPFLKLFDTRLIVMVSVTVSVQTL
jgi:hypothetical protein